MIALYVRVSTQEQAQNGHSIDEQTERLQAFCASRGWSNPKVYTDAGYSGGNTDRPALQNLVRDVKRKLVEAVLVYKLDRLSRSQLDTLDLIENVFIPNKCDFISISENFDTGSPLGKAMIGILAVFAQLEREQIKERMKMGREARAKQGKFHGSAQVPIGYDYIDGELVVNDFEKAQIIRIFELYASGMHPTNIAKTLNASGMEHRGGRWIQYTVRQILEKKTYIGYIISNGEWYRGTHEPIVSQEIFERVQHMIARNREAHEKKGVRAGKATAYLTGFLICGKCGQKYGKHNYYSYGGKKGKTVTPVYSCRNRTRKDRIYTVEEQCKNRAWKMEELDTIVFDAIKKLALEPEIIPQESPNILPELKDEARQVRQQIERLMDLYTVGGIPVDMLRERIEVLTDKRQKLEDAIEREEQEIKKEIPLPLLQSFVGILEKGDFDEIRAALSALLDHVELDDNKIRFFWNF